MAELVATLPAVFLADNPAPFGDMVAVVEQATPNAAQLLRAAGGVIPVPPSGDGSDTDFKVYTVAPLLGQAGSPDRFALVGEPDKWVSISAQRFSGLGPRSVSVSGAPGEVVRVNWADAAGAVISGVCTLPASGKAVMKVAASGAAC